MTRAYSTCSSGKLGALDKSCADRSTLLAKGFQIDEKRVSGERRKTLVGGVAISRRTHRQYLPDFLSRRGEKLYKFVSRISQIANAVAAGQRGYVQKNSTRPRKDHSFNLSSPAPRVQ